MFKEMFKTKNINFNLNRCKLITDYLNHFIVDNYSGEIINVVESEKYIGLCIDEKP